MKRRYLWMAVVAATAMIVGSVSAGNAGAATVKALPHATASTVTSDPNQYPVIWVHGIVSMLGLCAGVNADKQPATLNTMLASQGYTGGAVLGAAYYCGDSGSFDIRNAAGTYGHQYGNDVPIERLGLDLAWKIYNTYSSIGQYVYLAGHSMGGLIIRDALSKSGNPSYPDYPPSNLLVQAVLTYSTPYAGTDKAPNTTVWCGTTVQCQELAPGSAFIVAQQPMPAGPDISTIGGGPADNVDSFASSSAVNAQHKINYYSKTPVNYNHSTYYSDASTGTDEPFSATKNGVTYYYVAYHATMLGAIAILSPNW